MLHKLYQLVKKDLLYIVRDTKTMINLIVIGVLTTPMLFFALDFIEDYNERVTSEQKYSIGADSTVPEEYLNFIVDDQIEVTRIQKGSPEFEGDDFEEYDQEILVWYSSNNKELTVSFDNSSNTSIYAYNLLTEKTNQYLGIKRSEVLSARGISFDDINEFNVVSLSKQELTGETDASFIVNLIPLFLIIGVISGGIQTTIELTAGEKERNTMATTLSQNASRTLIGLGKVITATIISGFFTLLYTGSFIWSITNFVSGADSGISISFTWFETITLGALMIVNLLVINTFMVMVGLIARNSKEGNTYISPLILVAYIASLIVPYIDINSSKFIYLIPQINFLVLTRFTLLGETLNTVDWLLAMNSSLILFALSLVILGTMYRSENIVFRKT